MKVFGPIMSIFKFKEDNEVIARANSSRYGMYSSVFTKSLEKALLYSKKLQSGTVCINGIKGACAMLPFGGWKESACGREGGLEGLNSYCELKTVHIIGV